MLHPKFCWILLRRTILVAFGLTVSAFATAIAPKDWTAIASAQAQTPAELTMFVQQLDQAASQEDLSGVIQAYSGDLVHGDGLTRDDLEAALVQFWEQYDELSYETEIKTWERTGTGYTTKTETTITGTRDLGDQALVLTATLTAEQTLVDGQIISQDILSEQSSVSSGSNPPELEVNLPEQVNPGEQFYFDAIVLEPLGERLLLGMAIDEDINSTSYTVPSAIEFDVLTSGGLFKVGQAPDTPGQRWLSAVVIRDDGITGTTRRLQVAPGE
ncbi:MAG: nuclear transport factor 2 family protein [Elainellaceae cyanobacterium]